MSKDRALTTRTDRLLACLAAKPWYNVDWRTKLVSRSITASNGSVDVRRGILEEAGRLFLHYGFKKTTMDDIARRVGISKGALYLHFTSKEAIFSEISNELRSRVLGLLSEIATSDLPADAKLREMCMKSLLFVWDYHHEAPHAPEIWGEAAAMFSHQDEEFFHRCVDLVSGVIVEGKEQGLFRKDMDPKRTAWLMTMACEGFSPPYFRVSDRNQLEAGILDMTELLLDGLGRQRKGEGG